MRFLRSKFFLVGLCVAVVLSVSSLTLTAMGQVGWVRQALQTATVPIARMASAVADACNGYIAYFTDYDRLREENESLQEALREQEERLALADAQKEENDWLKQFFGMIQNKTVLTMEGASVLSCRVGGSSIELTLNRGSLHGIKAGMAVVTEEGVLGMVEQVGINSCTVTSLLEPGTAAGACIPRSQAMGLCEGTLTTFSEGLCRFVLRESDADVQVGDTVVTNGMGSVYPEGLLIGRVVSVRVDDFSKQKIAMVEPALPLSDLPSLSRVMILTGITVQTEESENSPTDREGAAE